MSPCEILTEPGCTSPSVLVEDRSEGVVMDNGVSEAVVELAMKPLSSLCISSPTTDRGEDDSVAVSEDSGIGGVGIEALHCVENTQVSIEKVDLECAIGAEEVVCDGLSERPDELVVVPLSGLDLSSQPRRDAADHGCSLVEAKDDTDFEPISTSYDLKCGPSINDPESGNVSSIKCTEGLCESGMKSFHTDLIVEGEVSSGVEEVVAGPSGSSGLCMVDANSTCHKLITESFVEAVSVGTVDHESSKILVTQELLKLSGSDAVSNLTNVAEVKEAENTGNDNGGTDGSFSLRRSSRSRKTVQQVQSGKSATRCTKKASKNSLRQTIDLLSEAKRKKRSIYNRSTCSSGWGTLENLSKYFYLSNEVAVNQVMDQGTRKKKAGARRGKKDVLKVVDRPAFSEVKQEVPCRPIRLKVTFGKKDVLGKGDGIPLAVVDIQGNDDKSGRFCSTVESSGGNVMDSSVPKEIPGSVQCNNSTSNVQLASSNLDDSEKQDGLCADKFLDPSTSPDSEVIDQLLDSKFKPEAFSSLHNSVNNESDCKSGPRNHCFPTKKNKNRRNKKDKLYRTTVLALECQHDADRAKMSTVGGVNFCSNDKVNAEIDNHPIKTELVSMELPDVEGSEQIPSLDNVSGINTYSGMIIGLESVSRYSCKFLPSVETHGKKNSKGSKTKGKSRNKSKVSNGLQKDPSSQQKGKKKLTTKHKVMETGISGGGYEIRGQPGTGHREVIDVRKTEFSKEEQTLAPRVAWVCCDDCLKWRCIPAVLADIIDSTNCRWACKDNQDQAFADCSIPQEKSNAEINAELQISDEEDARDRHLSSKALQPSTWMLITSNLFLHRNRKTQTMDEIMVCHCKPPVDGSLGCGSHCLNRMLNIECVQGTCPCGDLCSNQLFQRRKYAELSWLRCGKKGYGLQVLEDISEGQFLIEYVGEVLDLQTYEARQKDYASQGHKHFYFMTLNGNEVIDASAKGNLGRFVNHSCDPNCCTEKWVVNGEICVGLFALRNIKKGEELTFDYNYVRVFGAAAKKCHCGSRKCRGYIGGDPPNAEIIIQEDSDDEFPEPIVVNENGEIDHSFGEMMAKSSSQDIEPVVNEEKLSGDRSEILVESGEVISKVESSSDDSGPVQTVPGKDSSDEIRESTDSTNDFQPENLGIEHISSVKINTSSTEHTSSTPTSSPKSDVRHEAEIEREPHARPRPRMKIPRPPKSIRNRKSSSKSTSQRPAVLSCKPKKLLEGSANGHHEDVEKNLNELLDADGGICKKKDASKGYLKLLLLTAASGDSGNGGSIQSNRILSMILDAMLKTKSRGVLQDIINKNGLQMLHNMMKLYRRDFKKIPILRKLLKVLEFLAEKEILTVERINVDSLHPGVESFRESILFFTEHDDNQVHQIARSFRDRWIPHAKRYFRMDKNDRMNEMQRWSLNSSRHFGSCHHWREQAVERSSNLTDARFQEASLPQVFDNQTMANRPRKRKSRWDQPASPTKKGKILNTENNGGQKTGPYETKEENISNHRDDDMMHNSDDDDDAPPGFSYPHDLAYGSPPGFPSGPCPVSEGLLQTKFNPNIPVAYGIPITVVQKYGTPQFGLPNSWEIAPAMIFQPYPPLPPRPMGDQEQLRQGHHTHPDGQGLPSTSCASRIIVGTNQDLLHHQSDLCNGSWKRYHRPNWVSPKHRPPWVRNLDGGGFKGNCPPHLRNGSFRHKRGHCS